MTHWHRQGLFHRAIQRFLLPVTAATATVRTARVALDYWEHDPADFDYYVKNPTVDDLPVLLRKFDEEGLEVWPWVWTHPNNDGPHHVFVGMTKRTVQDIQRLRKESPQNNILIVATEDSLLAAADGSMDVYHECQCGIVTDARLQLLHSDAKILMLNDERVIAFDYLTIS